MGDEVQRTCGIQREYERQGHGDNHDLHATQCAGDTQRIDGSHHPSDNQNGVREPTSE
jgi:hypothetical protein